MSHNKQRQQDIYNNNFYYNKFFLGILKTWTKAKGG